MDYRRDDEGQQLRHRPELLEGGEEAAEVQVDVVVEPVVHHDVPLPVVRPELAGVPPVRVEGAVGEARDLRPEVEPAVEEAEEAHDEEEDGGHHEVDDCGEQRFEVEVVLELLDDWLAPRHVQDER